VLPKTKAKKSSIHFTLRGVPVVEKIFFIQNLALMIKTGFSIGDALTTLGSQIHNKQLRTTVLAVQQAVVKGESFSAALSQHPEVFDDLFTSMIAAGESSGNLEATLFQLAVQLKKSYALKKKIRNALIYPVLIITVMSVVGTGMFIFVIPKILDLYTTGGYTLPLPTRIILWMSDFITDNGLTLLIVLISCVIMFWLALRTQRGRFAWHALLLRLPIVGRILKRVNVAKISRLLHSLIVTDIPIVNSFQIIADTLSNLVYKLHLEKSGDQLAKGSSINSTLATRTDLFEPVVIQMIKVGEEAGVLDTMTEEIATFYEEEVDSIMANLTVIIEPILMIIIGIGVGFLAVSILLPIYALVDQV